MNSFCIVFLLVTTLLLTSSTITDATSISTSVIDDKSIDRKQPVGEPTFTVSNFQNKPRKMKVGGRMKRTIVEKDSFAEDVLKGKNEGEELIYNVDYHGVTTHPHPPSPKHPKP